MSKSKFKKGQLLVVTEDYSSCSCNPLTKGMLVECRAISKTDSYISISRYPFDPVGNWVPESNLRVLSSGKERTTAKSKFAKANRYEYAYIDSK